MIATAAGLRKLSRNARNAPSATPEKGTAVALREAVRRWMETDIQAVGRRRKDASAALDWRTVRQLIAELPRPGSAQPSASRSLDAPYLTSMLRTEILSPELESRLFQLMNDCKLQARRLQKKLSLEQPRRKIVAELERWMESAVEIRNRIVAANVRLVVSVARKFAGPRCSLTDLVSDGNLTLLKAVEKFDVSRGFRFSTYATWALRYDFVRTVRRRNSSSVGLQPNEAGLEDLADPRDGELDDRRRAADLSALEQMLTYLDPREHAIIERRYGLTPGSEECSLQEIAREFGICKERVRQLQLRALEKLRTSADRYLPEAGDA